MIFGDKLQDKKKAVENAETAHSRQIDEARVMNVHAGVFITG
jgi:hypothetical protein